MATCAARVSPPDLVALRRRFMVEPTSYAVIVGVDHELCVEAISRRLDALWRMSGRGCEGLKAAGGRVVFRIDNGETFFRDTPVLCRWRLETPFACGASHSSRLHHRTINRRQPLA